MGLLPLKALPRLGLLLMEEEVLDAGLNFSNIGVKGASTSFLPSGGFLNRDGR